MPAHHDSVYRNPRADISDRVDDLLYQMTIEEKVGQMCQWAGPGVEALKRRAFTEHNRESDTGDNVPRYAGVSVDDLVAMITRGEIGSFLSVYEPGEAELLQSSARESRLGIPLLVGVDAIHGHGMYAAGATVFPTPLCLASSFDTDLARRVARATALEMRAAGAHWTFSPNVDIVRDPRWGRVGETFGEDTLLVSRLGAAMVEGYQGDALADPGSVAACAKHFAAGGTPQNGLNFSPMDVSERTLRGDYLRPFRAAVDAGCRTIMAAHNEVNGVPCHGNRWLLTDVLRGEWGFSGFVVSDWTDVPRLFTLHRVAESVKDADRLTVESGMDMHMHGPGFFTEVLQLVAEGALTEARIDESVRRILTVKFELGLFDRVETRAEGERVPGGAESSGHAGDIRHNGAAAPSRDGTTSGPAAAEGCLATEDNLRLALEAARKSIVLLKNEGGILPLGREARRVFLTGPNAANQAILGDWAVEQPEGTITTILDGLREIADGEVEFFDTGPVRGVTADAVAEAARKAKGADVAIVVIGGDSLRFSGDGRTSGENVGRSDIRPLGLQEELVRAVHATGVPTVVVFVNGRPLSSQWIAERVPAIVEAWEPGSAGGAAVAEVLFGAVNPSGRLPITIPRSVGHIEQIYNHKPSAYYRHYSDGEDAPLFPFGHGLSYTSFSYDSLDVPGRVRCGDAVEVRVRVTNTGARSGDDVVLVFVRDEFASVTTPVRRLAAFARVALEPGESRTVTLTIPPAILAVFDQSMRERVEPGLFTVTVGDQDAPFEAYEDTPR